MCITLREWNGMSDICDVCLDSKMAGKIFINREWIDPPQKRFTEFDMRSFGEFCKQNYKRTMKYLYPVWINEKGFK
jgi:hypothetical protein